MPGSSQLGTREAREAIFQRDRVLERDHIGRGLGGGCQATLLLIRWYMQLKAPD